MLEEDINIKMILNIEQKDFTNKKNIMQITKNKYYLTENLKDIT